MRTKTKIILACGAILLICAVSVAGSVFYLFHHPASLTPMIEGYISEATGTVCTIREVVWSVKPLSVRVKGVLLKPLDPQHGLHLEIPDLKAEFFLEGPLGGRTLVLKTLAVDHFSLRLSQGFTPPKSLRTSGPPSLIGQALGGLVALLLFRDMRLEAAEVISGEISAQLANQEIHVDGLRATLDAQGLLSLSCRLSMQWPSKGTTLSAPQIRVTSKGAIPFSGADITCRVVAQEVSFKSPEFEVPRMEGKANLVFHPQEEKVSFEVLELRTEGIILRQEPYEGPIPLHFNLKSEGALDLRDGNFTLPVFSLNAGDALVLKGILSGRVKTQPALTLKHLDGDLLPGKLIPLFPERIRKIFAPFDLSGRVTFSGSIEGLEGREKWLWDCNLEGTLKDNLFSCTTSLRVEEEQTSAAFSAQNVHLFKTFSAMGLLPPGWVVGGQGAIQARALLKARGEWVLNSSMSLQGGAFHDRDSRFAGEKISIRAEIEGRGRLKHPSVTARTSLEIKGGELLLDRFYLDMNSTPLSALFEADYNRSLGSLELGRLKLDVKELLSVGLRGTLFLGGDERQSLLSVNIPHTPLKPLFHHLLAEPFKGEEPFLASLSVGGNISSDLELKGNGIGWRLLGHVLWEGGEILTKDRAISLKGIDLKLPVWCQHSVKGDTAGAADAEQISSLITDHPSKKEEAPTGALSIRSLVLPLLPEQPLRIHLRAGPNRLSVPTPTDLKVSGGNIEIGPLTCRDLLSQPAVITSLSFNALPLEPFLSGIWPAAVEGTIEGRLDPVHLDGSALTGKGDLKAKAFGGEIIISEIGGSGIFTSAPLLSLNARWDGLRLAELTRDTSFGLIHGILKGQVRDLEIAFGQPQKFDLLLETVHRQDTPQRISIAAVDTIAHIGGGESPFMGIAGAFSAFFKEFPYEKIGVHASLENDVFRINGTVREGEVEYLVKRGGFSGVNVVNQSPDNRISFKDMLKRIKRVQASGDAPVIK